MPSVVSVIEDQFERWAGSGGAIERDVLGTDDPTDIAEIFGSFCVRALASPPAGGLFYAASAGCVLGVHLESGDVVVVKAYQSSWGAPLLDAVQGAEKRIAHGGIPCPRPFAPPSKILTRRPNLAVVETWLPDPGMRPGGSVAARGVSAQGLAAQIALCRELPSADRRGLAAHPLRSDGKGLFGTPHSPLFDFESTGEGAEWIDDLARDAKRVRDEDRSALVAAHTDWSARNVRFDEERLLAVYDWDSLALVQESTAVGQAAMTWSVTADPGGTEFPELDSVLGYMDDYDRARGKGLSSGQRRAARAAAVYLLAYAARCEHSLAVRGLARSDQGAARVRLAELGAALLDLR